MEIDEIAIELIKISSEISKIKMNKGIQMFSGGELFVLNLLEHNESKLISKEIEQNLHVSSARVAAIVNQLERKNYVTRSLDSEDNRQTIVTITSEGQLFLNNKKKEVIQATVDMLNKLGAEDAREYLRLQKKILELK